MPKIDLSSLPGLETAKGLYGSITSADLSAGGDIIVDIMVYLYETAPPPPPPPGLFF